MMLTDILLKVEGLKVCFYNERKKGFIKILDDVSLDLKVGEVLGILGESGAGKTIFAHSIMGLIPHTPGIISGKIFFKGKNLLEGLEKICSIQNEDGVLKIRKDVGRWNKEFGYERKMKELRGKEISIIIQGAKSALNPFQTIHQQVRESYQISFPQVERSEADRITEAILDLVDLSERAHDYPHKLSGGMCQRVILAISLASNPSLLIADEATTGLDSSLKVKIIELMKKFKGSNFLFGEKKKTLSIIFISHELGVLSQLSDRIAVFNSGRVVEIGDVSVLKKSKALHPYTKMLLENFQRYQQREEVYTNSMIIETTSDSFSQSGGCMFYVHCRERLDVCKIEEPKIQKVSMDGHWVRCHRYADLNL